MQPTFVTMPVNAMGGILWDNKPGKSRGVEEMYLII